MGEPDSDLHSPFLLEPRFFLAFFPSPGDIVDEEAKSPGYHLRAVAGAALKWGLKAAARVPPLRSLAAPAKSALQGEHGVF